MGRFLLSVIVWLSLALGSVPAGDLRVATFNCEFLIKKKMEIKYEVEALSDAEREEKFAAAVETVAGVIRRIDADVIGLSEVGPEEDVEALRLAVTDEDGEPVYAHKAVCDSKDTFTGQHTAVLSKFPLTGVVKLLPGREFYDEEEDDPEEEDSTGVSKGMKVTFTFSGETIHFYACHLISERGGFEGDAQRVAQASIIRRHYLPLMNAGEHVIVTGDLNTVPGSPTLRRIRGRDDLYGDLIQTGLAGFFDEDRLEQRWTYQFQGRRQQIDHLLPSWSIKEATTRIRADILAVTETLPGGKKASDHRPLVVTLRFRD